MAGEQRCCRDTGAGGDERTEEDPAEVDGDCVYWCQCAIQTPGSHHPGHHGDSAAMVRWINVEDYIGFYRDSVSTTCERNCQKFGQIVKNKLIFQKVSKSAPYVVRIYLPKVKMTKVLLGDQEIIS